MTPAEIGKLTPAQVQHLLFRRRDKHGNIRRDPDKIPKDADPRAEFIDTWQRWGLTRDRAAELWREKQAEGKRKAKEKREAAKRGRIKKK